MAGERRRAATSVVPRIEIEEAYRGNRMTLPPTLVRVYLDPWGDQW